MASGFRTEVSITAGSSSRSPGRMVGKILPDRISHAGPLLFGTRRHKCQDRLPRSLQSAPVRRVSTLPALQPAGGRSGGDRAALPGRSAHRLERRDLRRPSANSSTTPTSRACSSIWKPWRCGPEGALAIVSLEACSPLPDRRHRTAAENRLLLKATRCAARGERSRKLEPSDVRRRRVAAAHVDMLVRTPAGRRRRNHCRPARGCRPPSVAADNPAGLAMRAPARRASWPHPWHGSGPSTHPPPGGAREGPHTHLLPKFLAQGRAIRRISAAGRLYCGLSPARGPNSDQRQALRRT